MEENIKFQMKVWNTMNMNDGCIATELKTPNQENRKWAGIYPFKNKDTGEMRFRYFEIELPKKFIEQDLDWFKDDEITEEIFVDSLQALYELLDRRGIDPLSFDVPWKFNYPYHY